MADIPGGYILVARKLLESELMGMPPHYAKAWLWLLLRASYSNGHTLRRGQCYFTLEQLAAALSYRVGYRVVHVSRRVAWSVCEWLRERHMCVTVKVARGLVATICQYERYQTSANYEGHDEEPTNETTKVMRTSCEGEHVSKEGKKEEGTKNSAFATFWSSWPRHKRKRGRAKCEAVWKRKALDGHIENILKVLEADSNQWKLDDGQFTPAPLVWLNQDRWDVAVSDLGEAGTGSLVGTRPATEAEADAIWGDGE